MSLSLLNDHIAWLSNMIDQGDHRRHPRKIVNLKGQYFTYDLKGELVLEQQHRDHDANVIDMSLCGAGVVSARPMNKGDHFTLVCETKTGKIKLALQVVRNDKKKSVFHYGCNMELCEKVS